MQVLSNVIDCITSEYSVDIVILKPKNFIENAEYIFFFWDESWSVVGPLEYKCVKELSKMFQEYETRFFVSCEEEFLEKGVPRDSYATDYFPENELNWL